MTLTVADAPATETTPSTAHFATPVTGAARVLHQIRPHRGSPAPGSMRIWSFTTHGDQTCRSTDRCRTRGAGVPLPVLGHHRQPSGTTLLPAGRQHTALGAHVGLRSTQLVAVDGSGQPFVRTLKLPLADLSPEDALEAVVTVSPASDAISRPGKSRCRVLLPGGCCGRVSSQAYGWDDVDVAGFLGRTNTAFRSHWRQVSVPWPGPS